MIGVGLDSLLILKVKKGDSVGLALGQPMISNIEWA